MNDSQRKITFLQSVLIFLFWYDLAVPPTDLPESEVEQDGKDTFGTFFLLASIWSTDSLATKLAFCIVLTIIMVKAGMQITPSNISKQKWWIPSGFIIGFGGWAFRAWSKLVLGNNFSYQIKVPTHGHLISDGPYQYIVHPGYLGVFFHLMGLFMIYRFDVRILLAQNVAVIAGIYLRVYEENNMLEQSLGEVWENHISDKYFLFPFIF